MCLRYQRCGGSRGYSHTLLLGSKRRTSWRCEELFILGSVVNWPYGVWTSTKPLPHSRAYPCNVGRWHGKGKNQQQRVHTKQQALELWTIRLLKSGRDKGGWPQVWKWKGGPALILARGSTCTWKVFKHGGALVTRRCYRTLQHV